jgi:uncharacterized protein involved in exopolysaccharide biosynthesis
MDLSFYFKLFLRRLHYFLFFLVLGTAAGVTIAVVLPPVYSSRAVLVVESERIPEEMASSTVQTEAREALQIIRQRILTRGRLLELANDFEIYGPPGSAERRRMTADEIVADLRRRIQINTSGPSRRGEAQATIVTVGFSAPSARLTAEVANEVVTAILEQNAELRQGVASETLDFFQDEVERLDRELSAMNADILEFREANIDALPDSLDFRRSQQAALQERLQQLERQEATLRDRRDRLVSIYETTGEIATREDAPQTQSELELSEMRRQMIIARKTLAEGNPRLNMLETRISALEEVVAQEQAGAAAADDGSDMQMTAYELQLADIDGQIEFLEEQQVQVQAEMESLQETIEATPANAVKLETMERDYAAVRSQYEEAVRNRARAETGDVIESLSKGQRISVIEQAVAPTSPDSPNRPLIAAGGVAAGGAAGLGIVLLLELLNTAIRRPADLQSSLGIQPFGTLPLIRTPGEVRRRRAILAAAAATCGRRARSAVRLGA